MQGYRVVIEALVSLLPASLIPHEQADAPITWSTETQYSEALWRAIHLSLESSHFVEHDRMGKFSDEC